jgi:hypothetical protein
VKHGQRCLPDGCKQPVLYAEAAAEGLQAGMLQEVQAESTHHGFFIAWLFSEYMVKCDLELLALVEQHKTGGCEAQVRRLACEA